MADWSETTVSPWRSTSSPTSSTAPIWTTTATTPARSRRPRRQPPRTSWRSVDRPATASPSSGWPIAKVRSPVTPVAAPPPSSRCVWRRRSPPRTFDLLGGTPSPQRRHGCRVPQRRQRQPGAGRSAAGRRKLRDLLRLGVRGRSRRHRQRLLRAGLLPDRRARRRQPGGRISSSLALAAITASADFNEGGLNRQNEDTSERFVRRTRCLDVGTVAGRQRRHHLQLGAGLRPRGRHQRPAAGQLVERVPAASGRSVTGNVREYPAAGLLVWDGLATGEPGLDNTTTSVSHTFLVDTPNAIDLGGGQNWRGDHEQPARLPRLAGSARRGGIRVVR